ncbi:hypothetical protein ASPVEDRAFT_39002 [Aspergillus versicolor CBS 583.65]|uniref:Transcription factor domain-containing protein n=1 Tax=Aspergillus versicolor CBS 583.65 TaxID=1036611 RepID=A0A1L9PDN2_ASPVE|nr:uncharacterized protein ASPVEDRAFT_39002 [Aspergillus versicolor CBS 583.65]OJI99598.1 hypothetical protein ASPVEDRAFT_39002 [Aspergillus versicolor CBS 583.65]
MPFHFINNDDVLNDGVKKQIRSYAAVGRNKGRKISRRSRKDVSTLAATTPFRIPLTLVEELPAERHDSNEVIERPVGDGLFFPGLLPGESNGVVKKVISFMSAMRFPYELNHGLDYGGLGAPLCVQNMFIDEACFHSTMAMALLCMDNIVSQPGDKVLVLRHASNTVRLVNQKLSLNRAVNDLTIAAVVSMAQYEYRQNKLQQGSAHVQGLWQIVQLRGCLSNPISSTAGLVQKILRIDLEYALQLGSPTLFSLEEVEMACKPVAHFPSLRLPSDPSNYPQTLEPYTLKALPAKDRDLFIDVLLLASLLNKAIAGVAPKLHAVELDQDMILLGYRLLRLKPLGLPPGTSRLQHRVHLGMAAFLMTFLHGWDGSVTQNDALVGLLLSEVQRPFNSDENDLETFLWLLFIGAASLSLWKHPKWISITKDILQGLKVKRWEDVKELLARYPWVNAVHDPAGQELWHGSNDGNCSGLCEVCDP